MAKLKSKHAVHNGIRNEIGVKKLHTKINNGKSGNKKLTNAGTIPIRRRGNEFELCVVAKADLFSQKVKLFKTKN